MHPLMKLKMRPTLTLLALILASLACLSFPEAVYYKGRVQCNMQVDETPSPNTSADKPRNTMYLCTCPVNGRQQEVTFDHLRAVGDDDIFREACGPDVPLPTDPPQAVDTDTPTPQDTSTPTATATPQPYLNGEVSACNLGDGFINFALDPNVTDATGTTFDVTLGGQAVQCAVPASNTKVLSCSLPRTQTFPAEVIIHVNDSLTDTFTYDGSDCTVPGPNPGDPPQQPDGEPTCTGLPPYPEGCTPP